MQSDATNVDACLDELPASRRDTLAALRDLCVKRP